MTFKEDVEKMVGKTPLLVLAGNPREYDRWARENREKVHGTGLAPRYLPTKGLNYLGYKKCFYLEIGTFIRPSFDHPMYRYFRSHGILNAVQTEAAK